MKRSRKKPEVTLYDKAIIHQERLKEIIKDPQFKKYKRDLEMLVCVVWFDFISDRLTTDAAIKKFVRTVIYKQVTPVFDPGRVSQWLIDEFGYLPEIARRRMAVRDTYERPENKGVVTE